LSLVWFGLLLKNANILFFFYFVVKGLVNNPDSPLTFLDLSANKTLTTKSVTLLSSVLAVNNNLAILLLDDISMTDPAGATLMSSLQTNSNLVKLSLACKYQNIKI
jgi:hypothetical protein